MEFVWLTSPYMYTNEYLTLGEVKKLVLDKQFVWKDKANCIGVDSTLFVPADDLRGRSVSQHYKQAKKYCYECSVRSECLAFALVNGLDMGLFGGLSPKERKSLHNRLPVKEIFKKKDLQNGRTI